MSIGESTRPKGFITAALSIPSELVHCTAPPPDTLTQRNVEAVTGIPSRVYLELIRKPGFPLRVTRLGKLRLVNRAAFVVWLEDGGFAVDAMPASVPANDSGKAAREDELDAAAGAHELLASVGLREQAPTRRARRKR